MSGSPTSNPNSDTGLASHIASGISAFFPPLAGVIFYFIEKKDQLGRHWAVQSIFFGVSWLGLCIAYSILSGIFVSIPFLGPLLLVFFHLVLVFRGFIPWL